MVSTTGALSQCPRAVDVDAIGNVGRPARSDGAREQWLLGQCTADQHDPFCAQQEQAMPASPLQIAQPLHGPADLIADPIDGIDLVPAGRNKHALVAIIA
jgi:hypothetical protein